jgi:hypothetical protein
MAVVIDEMQVDVAEPRQQQQGHGGGSSDSGGGGGGGAGQPPKPEDVQRAMRVQAERAERVWAH